MADRPIIFSEPMVRAILNGTKTQTRRIVKVPHGSHVFDFMDDTTPRPYWVGDHLWVRETFSPVDANGHKCAIKDASFVVFLDGAQKYRDGAHFHALPTYAPGAFDGMIWRPSIYMPRWASRITLKVKRVTIDRLRNITNDEALAEGVDPYECPSGPAMPCAKSAFAELWDKINAKRAPWSSNPWVWVVAFERTEAGRG